MSRALLLQPLRTAVFSSIALIALFAQVGRADDDIKPHFFKNYFITGDAVVGGVGLATAPLVNGFKTGQIKIGTPGIPNGSAAIPLGADIEAAFLYWNTESNLTLKQQSQLSNVVDTMGYFDGHKIIGMTVGNSKNPGCNATYGRAFRADVLQYLPIDGVNNIRVATGAHTVSFRDGTNGASLVVVYRIIVPGKPLIEPYRAVVIFDGAYTTSKKFDLEMAGFYQAYQTSPAVQSKLIPIVGNGQPSYKETLNVTDSTGPGNFKDPFVGGAGARWDNPTLAFTMKSNDSSYSFHVTTNDCLTYSGFVTVTRVVDTDYDGLLDIWEMKGVHLNDHKFDKGVAATFGTCADYPKEPANCVNLPAMGANPNKRDIYIEVDWEKGSVPDDKKRLNGQPYHEHKVQYEALQRVYNLFAAHQTAIHFDMGNNYQDKNAPFIIPLAAITTLHKGGEVIDETLLECPNRVITDITKCAFPKDRFPFAVQSYVRGFNVVKEGSAELGIPPHFSHVRKDVFRYLLFAHAFASYEFDPNTFLPLLDASGKPIPTNPLKSVSGVGDKFGANFMITFGLWRFENADEDKVGSIDSQTGTIAHELGHNLGLSHSGLNRTPNCWPTYISPMNYLYQVAAFTDFSDGRSPGPPVNEGSLDENQPLNTQQPVRYYGPARVGLEGSAKVHCDGTTNLAGDRFPMVRVTSPSLGTPDWNRNKQVDGIDKVTGRAVGLGPYALDINFDGKEDSVFSTSNDWDSMNLQQVGSRLNANGLSLDMRWQDVFNLASIEPNWFQQTCSPGQKQCIPAGIDSGAIEPGAIEPGAIEPGAIEPGAIEPGAIEPGAIEPGAIEPGASVNLGAIEPGAIEPGVGSQGWIGTGAIEPGAIEPGAIEPGAIEPGAIEPGAIEPGAIEPGDLPYLVLIKSDTGSTAPQNLTAVNDKDGITLAWDHGKYGDVAQYNIWRSDPDHPLVAGHPFDTCPVPNTGAGANPRCTVDAPGAPPYKYRDPVNEFAKSGAACPSGLTTCYETNYDYYVTAMVKTYEPPPADPTTESGSSNTAGSKVTHRFVIANDLGSLQYGTLPLPDPTNSFTVYGSSSAGDPALTGVSCKFVETPVRNVRPSPYTITCDTTPHVDQISPKTGVTYNVAYNESNTIHQPGRFNITPAPLTITAQANTKTYDANTKATLAAAGTQAMPTVSGLKYTDTVTGRAEEYDNKNVLGSPIKTLFVSAYTVNDGGSPQGFNYTVTTVDNHAGVINKADPAIAVTPYSVTYDGLPHTATGSATGVVSEALSGLNLSGTTHTDAGDYLADPWVFTDVTGNYNNANNSVHDHIEKAPSTTTVTCPAGPYTYNGSAQTPCSATVTGAGGLNQALTVNYTNNVNAGMATASASFDGDSNHFGSNDSKNFTIDKAPSTVNVTCDSGPFTFNGSAQTPCSATVTGAGGLSQVLTVNYSNNINAGMATASASFGGDSNHLSSDGSKNFTINQAPSTTAVTCGAGPFIYNGSAQTPCSATVTGAGGLNQALTVNYANNVNAGMATASANFGGDANHFSSSDSKNFTINQAPVIVTLSNLTQTYTGAPLSPTVTTTPPVSYVLSGAPDTDPGSYPVTATVTNPNYAGSAGGTFTINPSVILSGSILRIDPPVSIAPNQPSLESDTHMFFFAERTNLNLSDSAHVSISAPGNYPPNPLTPGNISGTRVDTYFLHADQVGTSGNNTLLGSITFDTDVLGIQTGNSDGLSSQSSMLGAIGTSYSGSLGPYELGTPCPSADKVALSSDLRTVTVCSTTSTNADDLRIIVRAHN